MPTKGIISKAQYRHIEKLHAEGQIEDEDFKRYVEGVDYEILPERAKPRLRKIRRRKV